MEIEVDDVGPSLRNASAKVSKVSRSKVENSSTARSSSSRGQADADPWANDAPGGYSDEAPF